MAVASSTVAAVTAGAALVSAGAATVGAIGNMSDRKQARELRKQQADDILGQLDAEKLIYKDELEMISKQTQLAESKLNLQSGQQIEGIGEKLSDIYAQVQSGNKYGGGASKRATAELEGKYDEGLSDIKESYEMSMDDLALRDEQAERSAFLKHEEIMGSLEAQREELLAMS